jgi:hypothetical protein
VQAVASGETGNQTGFQGPGMHMGYEMFETLVDPEAAARSAARTALTMRPPALPSRRDAVPIDSALAARSSTRPAAFADATSSRWATGIRARGHRSPPPWSTPSTTSRSR